MIEIQVFENLGPGKFTRGYDPKEDHTLIVSAILEAEDLDSESWLAELWNKLNQDDRPNRYIAPSLSVGDVVTIMDAPTKTIRSYTCELIGWSRLDTVVTATEGAREEYHRRLAQAAWKGGAVTCPEQELWLDSTPGAFRIGGSP